MLDFLDIVVNKNDACAGIGNVLFYGVYIVKVIQIVVPIALIIWGSIDLLKSIISGDEKKISAARKPFIQRLLSAVLVFLLPWLVNVVISFASGNSNQSKGKAKTGWAACWVQAWNSNGLNGTPWNIWSQTN